MSYKLNYTDRFKETIREMDRPEVIRILKKLEWVAQNAEQVEHERLKKPPSGLERIDLLPNKEPGTIMGIPSIGGDAHDYRFDQA